MQVPTSEVIRYRLWSIFISIEYSFGTNKECAVLAELRSTEGTSIKIIRIVKDEEPFDLFKKVLDSSKAHIDRAQANSLAKSKKINTKTLRYLNSSPR